MDRAGGGVRSRSDGVTPYTGSKSTSAVGLPQDIVSSKRAKFARTPMTDTDTGGLESAAELSRSIAKVFTAAVGGPAGISTFFRPRRVQNLYSAKHVKMILQHAKEQQSAMFEARCVALRAELASAARDASAARNASAASAASAKNTRNIEVEISVVKPMFEPVR